MVDRWRLEAWQINKSSSCNGRLIVNLPFVNYLHSDKLANGCTIEVKLSFLLSFKSVEYLRWRMSLGYFSAL